MRQIDLTPPPLKNFAISEFGSHDKAVLVAGILVLLAVFAAAFGVAAMRRLGYGLAGLAVFTGVGLIAALALPHRQRQLRRARPDRRRCCWSSPWSGLSGRPIRAVSR